ncbi:unnamed protein product [Heterobilharzia americana]|nr:unnamed protein product [Heterobilharzia americana]
MASVYNSDDVDPSRLVIKYGNFSRVLHLVCASYTKVYLELKSDNIFTGKIDRCADLQSLLDTLSSIGSFYQGSQSSIEAALSYGKSVGSQYLRLHLRDLAYENVKTSGSSNGVEFYVPLRSFLSNTEQFNTSGNLLRKRPRHCAYCPRRSKRIALDHCVLKRCQRKRSKNRALFPILNTISADPHLFSVIESLSGSMTSGPLSNSQELVCDGLIRRRKRNCHILPEYQTNSCSCDTKNHHEPINQDPFAVFQDAVQVINLLDPLSRFSVTSGPGKLQNSFKRPRVDSPTSPKVVRIRTISCDNLCLT